MQLLACESASIGRAKSSAGLERKRVREREISRVERRNVGDDADESCNFTYEQSK